MPALSPSAPAAKYQRIDYQKYVVIPIWYHCNSKCTFCMVEKQMGELPTVDFDNFKRIVSNIVQTGQHENLILSGGEVTTFDQLEKYVAYAGSLGWFKRIQIQTNARRLSNKDYTQRLLDAGLNEFFISLHGLEEVQDAVTEIRGGYRETMRGFEHVAAAGANIITNTVLTRQNFDGLLPLFEMIAASAATEMHMWNYFPMAGDDSKNLLVNMKDFFNLLPDILAIVERVQKPLVFKGFPECLSLGEPGFFDNRFPLNLIDKAFWDNFDENEFGRCIYKSVCKAKICMGLSKPYRDKFGNEADLLTPFQ
jgi:MoaA/NifB/PqqE/SkfB family radical SAM enzyme